MASQICTVFNLSLRWKKTLVYGTLKITDSTSAAILLWHYDFIMKSLDLKANQEKAVMHELASARRKH